MNGAESLVRTLVACGVDTCFANPGTSEMHFVSALDSVAGMQAVLCLFEGVVTGCADGYARMAGRPAATLLHLGPGLANGLANLHNARRAASPVVNIVGDHATRHLEYDAPLTSDVAAFARPVSAWVSKSTGARSVGLDAAHAVQAARTPPGNIATLILPADAAWGSADGPAAALPIPERRRVAEAVIGTAHEALRGGSRTAMLLRGQTLGAEALTHAGRVAAVSGCRLLCDTFAPRVDRGAGIVAVERIPYFAEQIVDALKNIDTLLLFGAKPPVAFFAYPDKPSWCLPKECKVICVAEDGDDGMTALACLADRICPSGAAPRCASLELPDYPTGKFNAYSIGKSIARHLPQGAIISDDAATSSPPVLTPTATARAHTHLALTGGSIGQGLPVAAGAAIACPNRKVICLTGDGSALYTPQALWTIARERLDVTTVVFANRAYRILGIELGRLGAAAPGPKARAMLELSEPSVDWSALARGWGVAATRADTIDAFESQFADAMRSSAPCLIEAVL